MIDWAADSLEDDIRPHLFAAAAVGQPFALATISAADGGPRPCGSQMVVTGERFWGFLSGGCIEADVALHGREVMKDGEPRTLIYGRGSPFIDMRLPCGGRLEVLVERIGADEPALEVLRSLTEARTPALWESDGHIRTCRPQESHGPALATAVARRLYLPEQRLAVVGSDPFAIAIAGLGACIGWDTLLVSALGSEAALPPGVRSTRVPVAAALAELAPDPWTAIAVATHDLELDQDALHAGLRSPAGYVGVLGSRRRLPERIAGLRAAGVGEAELARLRAPIGLDIGARSPWEVAIAVVAEIIEAARLGAQELKPSMASLRASS